MLAAVLAASGACSTGAPSGEPSPPAPREDGPLVESPGEASAGRPVEGELTVRVEAADPGPVVFHDRDDPAPDEAAVGAFAEAVKEWLDGHLTDLQADGDGTLEDVAADGLLGGAGQRAAAAAITSGLASPDEPVASAVYHVVVVHTGGPDLARVTAYVRAESGRLVTAGFLFTPAPLTLVAAGPEPSP